MAEKLLEKSGMRIAEVDPPLLAAVDTLFMDEMLEIGRHPQADADGDLLDQGYRDRWRLYFDTGRAAGQQPDDEKCE